MGKVRGKSDPLFRLWSSAQFQHNQFLFLVKGNVFYPDWLVYSQFTSHKRPTAQNQLSLYYSKTLIASLRSAVYLDRDIPVHEVNCFPDKFSFLIFVNKKQLLFILKK